ENLPRAEQIILSINLKVISSQFLRLKAIYKYYKQQIQNTIKKHRQTFQIGGVSYYQLFWE
ncbi:MAG: hypothetical protein II440_04735, partial [Clostridia bacterium]|nr:hypothetical protein [Clostridia bacterium]